MFGQRCVTFNSGVTCVRHAGFGLLVNPYAAALTGVRVDSPTLVVVQVGAGTSKSRLSLVDYRPHLFS
jgi:hypothetical protein